jgi:hypothetical protein
VVEVGARDQRCCSPGAPSVEITPHVHGTPTPRRHSFSRVKTPLPRRGRHAPALRSAPPGTLQRQPLQSHREYYNMIFNGSGAR